MEFQLKLKRREFVNNYLDSNATVFRWKVDEHANQISKLSRGKFSELITNEVS